jgi:hypothetical protein
VNSGFDGICAVTLGEIKVLLSCAGFSYFSAQKIIFMMNQMEQKTLRKIRKLAGPITEDQLRYVDCAVSDIHTINRPMRVRNTPSADRLEVRFASTAHFSSTFSKLVGVCPLQYRRNIS